MTRRTTIIVGGTAALVVAALLVAGAERRAKLARSVPAWLQFDQPPDSLSPDLQTLSDAESWAANRCSHIVAACPGYTARNRVRRVYPATLAESADSLVRANFELRGGINA